MTCIIGMIKDGEVYIGGDSAGVSGYYTTQRKDHKVFKKGKFVFGFTSSFRMGQIIQFCFNPPEIDEKKDTFEYMVSDFIPALKLTFKEHGFNRSESSVDSCGTFLCGVNGRLFAVEDDYQVSELMDDFASVGCGREIAMGAMSATSIADPRDAILNSLLIVEKYSAGVCSPFNIVTTGE